jgi:TP901 family phage tail tape measure protein
MRGERRIIVPATVRDILLLIRAKDEASKAFGTVAGNMKKASTAADVASARARAAAARSAAVTAKASGATRSQVQALNNSAKAYDQEAKDIERASKQQTQYAHSASAAGKAAVLAGGALIVGGAATLVGLKKAVDVAVDWDKQVRLTFTQVDKKYKPSLKALGDIGISVASNIATPFEGIQDALFEVFSSTDANMPQAKALVSAFAKAAVAGNTDIQTASKATIGLMNSYSVPFKDVNKVLNVQFELVKEGVGSYQDWAQRIGLVTPSAVRAGQSMEMMAAALATSTRMGTSAARSATSVARAFDAMSNPITEANLKKIGVATRDAKGQFRPMVDVLGDWKKKLDALPKQDRVAAILSALKGAGGTIEARRFLQNMLLTTGGLKQFQQQVKNFSHDKNAFTNAYADMSKSVSSQTQLLHNQWKIMELAIGQALLPTFTKLVSGLGKIVGWFNKLSPGTKSAIAQFALWGSVLGIAAGAVLVILGALTALAGAILSVSGAILPLIGGIAASVIIFAGLTAAIVGLAAAFIAAYRSSTQLQALVAIIGGGLKGLWDIVLGFAQGVYRSFMANVMPPLRQLWAIIQTQVIPAVSQFIAKVQSSLLPAIQNAAGILQKQLTEAFRMAGDVIKDDIIPAISSLVKWWNTHQKAIMPVVRYMVQLIGFGLKLAALLAGTLIKGIILSIGAFVKLASGGIHIAVRAVQLIISSVKSAISAFRSVASAVRSFGSTVSSIMSKARSAVGKAISSIKGAFSGAGGWLVSAGRNVIMGLVHGITGSISSAASAAANVAKTALHAAKAALGIHSPSKAFKDIGANVVRGFVLGITGNAKKVSQVMFSLSEAIKKSISGAKISKHAKKAMSATWTRKLSSASKKLNADAKKRDALETKLAAATKSYNDQLKVRADLISKINDAVAASADLTSLDPTQQTSTKTMIQGLTARITAVRTFAAQLRDLAKRGLDKQTIADLASQGVDAAGAMVATLDKGSTADLKTISSMQAEIRKMAKSTGTDVAGDLYNAGIAAAKGLVNGLNSQIKSITKAMKSIANALVKAIKKALGIKSPSRVMAKVGTNTALGYVNGYLKTMNDQNKALANASVFTPAQQSLMTNKSGYGTPSTLPGNVAPTKTISQYITIHTNEIDPRKTSAQLGWELMGKVN